MSVDIIVRVLPTLMFVESLGASALYAWAGDWKMAAYWVSAACITASLTYLP